jgi:hypothetical protein
LNWKYSDPDTLWVLRFQDIPQLLVVAYFAVVVFLVLIVNTVYDISAEVMKVE